jgi:hypothetical protein
LQAFEATVGPARGLHGDSVTPRSGDSGLP